MLSPSSVLMPLLILLAILCCPSQAAPSPPSPTVDVLAQPDPPPGVFLHRRSSGLRKRSSSERTRTWALIEAARVRNRYGNPLVVNVKRVKRQEAHTGIHARLDTPISVAGYGTAGSSTSSSARAAPTSTSGSTSRGSSSTTPRPTAPVGQVRIWNYDADLAYYASVGVGSPPQYMNVLLDTGSADLWITGNNCTNATGCTSTPLLNETSSSSSIDMATSFSVKYGSGSAAGDLYRDYVGFAGYNVSNQTFAVVDTISNDLLSGNMSGLLGESGSRWPKLDSVADLVWRVPCLAGLGWQPLAASGATPFWENLNNAGVLPFPGFAVQLTRFVNISSATSVEPGGLLTFGYLNTTLYRGDIHYTSIPTGMQSYWVIPMAAVTINGTNVTMPTDAQPLVAIDTGTTLIGGPQSVVSQVYAGIPGALAATGQYTGTHILISTNAGYYSYPCASKINVSLTFGNNTWPIASDDFNLGPFGTTNNVSTCLGAFFDLSLSSTSKISWVIGAAFLKNVFSVYRANPPSVGFALLSNGSAPASSSNSSSNTTRGDGNLTQIPAGIYGPVGGTSISSSASPTALPADQGITTAIQAGQTSSRAPTSAATSNKSLRISKELWLAPCLIAITTVAGWSALL
ncbi:BQ2448_5863 [Microbotryum intermedium]|uniref:BQ2448_5863 protein n=1 Tax=Microbotryum intermedium TaxID=269621 RepID=A0A238F2E7_9BASI|nr:BQ2448_5863 [Microbotryum intermedium]